MVFRYVLCGRKNVDVVPANASKMAFIPILPLIYMLNDRNWYYLLIDPSIIFSGSFISSYLQLFS